MSITLHIVPDPPFLHTSNVNANISPTQKKLSFSINYRNFQVLCAANRRNKFGIAKSGKIMVQSAYIIASRLGILPEPIESLLREFGGGNGGRNGFWNGFGWGGFGGGKRRRRTKLGIVGILVICSLVGLWLVMGKELVFDSNALFGGLGLVLFGLSVEGWRSGAKDWILGFCCCAFMMGLVLKKDDFQKLVRTFNKRKRRAF